MKLIDPEARDRLLANGAHVQRAIDATEEPDPEPVVKLFTPDGAATWLLTELDPDDPDLAFGLCDLGSGFPELGAVRLSELISVRGPLGLPIERDRWFLADRPISQYASEARAAGRITA